MGALGSFFSFPNLQGAVDKIGEEPDLGIEVTSRLSSISEAHGTWVASEGTSSKDDPSTASSIGPYGCTLLGPLRGEDEGIEPSLNGASWDSCCRARNWGNNGIGALSLPEAGALLALDLARRFTGRWNWGGASLLA